MAVKHTFVSAKADDADATLVRPSDWNAAHTIEANTVSDAEIAAHTTTKITTTSKALLPAAIAYEDEANVFILKQRIELGLELKDVDVTPVGDVFLRVMDEILEVRNATNNAFRKVNVNSIPDLDAGKITTGRFGMARMPDGAITSFIRGGGVGADPLYAIITKTELPTAVAYEDEINIFTLRQRYEATVEGKDLDATPVADRRLAIIDGLWRARDTLDAEGRFISRLSLELLTDAELAAAIYGTPSGLANINTVGTGTLLPRIDHQHKRDVRVKRGDIDIGTRNALNIIGPDIPVTDDAVGDKIDLSFAGLRRTLTSDYIEATLTLPSAETDLYSFTVAANSYAKVHTYVNLIFRHSATSREITIRVYLNNVLQKTMPAITSTASNGLEVVYPFEFGAANVAGGICKWTIQGGAADTGLTILKETFVVEGEV